jgi:glycosyltransferase involved in cell wall biosynthesis
MVLRLYDVTCVLFNGFNAHRIQDIRITDLCGQRFITLSQPGTTQLAEAGFLLRNGEFIPAARSLPVQFPPGGVSRNSSYTALMVNDKFRLVTMEGGLDQARALNTSRGLRLRKPLRIASFAFDAAACGQQGALANYVSELAAGLAALGHEVHVFVPGGSAGVSAGSTGVPAGSTAGLRQLGPIPAVDSATEGSAAQGAPPAASRQIAGVYYELLEGATGGSPVEAALSFARQAEQRLRELPPFDLFHLHEWMTALAPWTGTRATVLSMTSIEKTRRNGAEPTGLSLEIEKVEREIAPLAGCVLTPEWLREKTVAEFGLNAARVYSFPMEGRMPDEWETPLDCAKVKSESGLEPWGRLLLFVGPLEYPTGVDLLIEALPVVLGRVPALRLGIVGDGPMYDALQRRAHELGAGHAVRLFGHLQGKALTRLLRACEAVLLPSRSRIPTDEGVVDLARKAGRPVVTTHAGPAHLVRHEENGIVTYDNPGSMVWALDRILGDPAHAGQMGRNGRRSDLQGSTWKDIAAHFLELCAESFPELSNGSA